MLQPTLTPKKVSDFISPLQQDGTTIKKEDLDAKAGGIRQVQLDQMAMKLSLSGETGEEGGGEGWVFFGHMSNYVILGYNLQSMNQANFIEQ